MLTRDKNDFTFWLIFGLSSNLGLSESLSKRLIQQELSYRKQIARQLRTQYIEGIYDLNITP